MNRSPWVPTVAALSAVMLTTPSMADHIPGHDDCDQTFPVPLPDQNTFNGGIIFITAIGPLSETQILETTFGIKYVSDGTTPARDLLFNVSVQVDGEVRELVLTGEDLGFGEGPGTFRCKFATTFFNGEVWGYESFSQSIVDIGIGAVDGGVEGTGYFVDSFITFELGLRIEGTGPTALYYPSPFDVVTGLLSELHTARPFDGAECLGTFSSSSGYDSSVPPGPDQGRYYLARNLDDCVAEGYGDSSLHPDPRDWLNSNSPCP